VVLEQVFLLEAAIVGRAVLVCFFVDRLRLRRRRDTVHVARHQLERRVFVAGSTLVIERHPAGQISLRIARVELARAAAKR
jgi:hypothetical protein